MSEIGLPPFPISIHPPMTPPPSGKQSASTLAESSQRPDAPPDHHELSEELQKLLAQLAVGEKEWHDHSSALKNLPPNIKAAAFARFFQLLPPNPDSSADNFQRAYKFLGDDEALTPIKARIDADKDMQSWMDKATTRDRQVKIIFEAWKVAPENVLDGEYMGNLGMTSVQHLCTLANNQVPLVQVQGALRARIEQPDQEPRNVAFSDIKAVKLLLMEKYGRKATTERTMRDREKRQKRKEAEDALRIERLARKKRLAELAGRTVEEDEARAASVMVEDGQIVRERQSTPQRGPTDTEHTDSDDSSDEQDSYLAGLPNTNVQDPPSPSPHTRAFTRITPADFNPEVIVTRQARNGEDEGTEGRGSGGEYQVLNMCQTLCLYNHAR